ncbi:hypothetical protein GOP47_0021270 [Adiantum capillus-veneris]|uniref:Uncharacterized protein n=1 Tax=Adiantum capillus-veneris TaxID=13818 RepID=A0A9D4Z8B6_ADICA|nr:hypothetical protein GOP47_0021270 [Adiantum capillus-veneris]
MGASPSRPKTVDKLDAETNVDASSYSAGLSQKDQKGYTRASLGQVEAMTTFPPELSAATTNDNAATTAILFLGAMQNIKSRLTSTENQSLSLSLSLSLK